MADELNVAFVPSRNKTKRPAKPLFPMRIAPCCPVEDELLPTRPTGRFAAFFHSKRTITFNQESCVERENGEVSMVGVRNHHDRGKPSRVSIGALPLDDSVSERRHVTGRVDTGRINDDDATGKVRPLSGKEVIVDQRFAADRVGTLAAADGGEGVCVSFEELGEFLEAKHT